MCLFQTEANSDMHHYFLFDFLTSLGSALLVRESYRDSSLSQLVPHRISLAPLLWKRWAHSEQKEKQKHVEDLHKKCVEFSEKIDTILISVCLK